VCGDRAVVTDDFAVIRGAPQTGRAFVFERSGSTWTPVGELHSESDMIGSGFGWSAAISRQAVAAGEIYDDTIYVAPLTPAATAMSWVPGVLGWFSTDPADR
jgi:acyl-CoA synthetase (AMP-forming)/AMP-acid ligase II